MPVLTGKVDIASVRIEFESGCIANFTASRISTERVRKLRFFQPAQYVSLDYSRRDVFSLTVRPAAGGMPEIVPLKPPVSKRRTAPRRDQQLSPGRTQARNSRGDSGGRTRGTGACL